MQVKCHISSKFIMIVQYDQPAPCTASWLVGYPPFSIVIILSDNAFVNNFSPRSAYVASRNTAKDPVPTIMTLMWPSCNAIIEDLLIGTSLCSPL